MRDFYDLDRRSELLGRTALPVLGLRGVPRRDPFQDSGERQEFFAAYDGDRMVATAILFPFLLDNTEKAWADINVDVPDRRRGLGRALVERRRAARPGRQPSIVMTDAHLPFDDRETHGYRQFAEACGFELANYEVTRHLTLPVPDERIQEWLDEAAPGHEGYTIETFVDAVPDDLVESLCLLLGQLAVDAPTGAVDFEEEEMTPQRYAEMRGHRCDGPCALRDGRPHPRPPGGRAVDLALSLKDNTTVYQWGTFVHREHRGHRWAWRPRPSTSARCSRRATTSPS